MSWPVTPDDVRTALRQAAQSPRVDEADLARFAQQAMTWVESQVGPCRGQTFTTVVRSRGLASIILDHAAAEVTDVTVDGAPFEGWTFDEASPREVLGPFPSGRVVVTAMAPTVPPGGRAPDPEADSDTGEASPVEGAAIMLAAHWWLQERPGAGGDGGAGSPMGYGIPNRVRERLEPFVEDGGFA